VRTYHIAWWNLENLFDEEDAVALGRRTDKVFRAIKNDIAGWTQLGYQSVVKLSRRPRRFLASITDKDPCRLAFLHGTTSAQACAVP
jgi:hypothetical protein